MVEFNYDAFLNGGISEKGKNISLGGAMVPRLSTTVSSEYKNMNFEVVSPKELAERVDRHKAAQFNLNLGSGR